MNAPQPRPRFEEYLREECRPWRSQLPKVAGNLLEGKLPRSFEALQGRRRGHLLNDVFQWAVGDSAEARMQWEVLSRHGRGTVADRDAYVAALWVGILDEKREAFQDFRQLIDETLEVREYYQRHLFRWFLSRFDLVRARRVFPHAQLTGGLHGLLLGLSLAAVWGCFQLQGVSSEAAVWVAACALALAAGGWVLARLPLSAYLHSLVPRLGATVAIGFLFLAAAPELLRVIYEQGLPTSTGTPRLSQWTLAVLLALATWAYTALHVHRRVQPALRAGTLLRRAGDLVAVALGYAVLGVGVAAPLLFHPSLLYHGQERPGGPPGPHQLALCAAIALSLGVVLQLAWEEKPLTEPL